MEAKDIELYPGMIIVYLGYLFELTAENGHKATEWFCRRIDNDTDYFIPVKSMRPYYLQPETTAELDITNVAIGIKITISAEIKKFIMHNGSLCVEYEDCKRFSKILITRVENLDRQFRNYTN